MKKKIIFPIRSLLLALIISSPLLGASGPIQSHAKKLVHSSFDDEALKQELSLYSANGLNELREAVCNIKSDPEVIVDNQGRYRAVNAFLSLPPAALLFMGIKVSQIALEKFRYYLQNVGLPFRFSEYALQEAKAGACFGAALSLGGLYLLWQTVPNVISTFSSEKAIIERANHILDLIDKKLATFN